MKQPRDALSKRNRVSIRERVPTQERVPTREWVPNFPRLIGLHRSGRLQLDELIARTYSTDEAPRAFADLQEGRPGRGVIVFGDVT